MSPEGKSSQTDLSRLSYRAEIDGLRAIAVISVIFYHAQLVLFGRDWFDGGYIGVDIFFVISGYLITRLILAELQSKGTFSFKNFYERRARRILPMLLVVILASIPFAWQKLLPPDFIEYAESVLASLFFTSNFFFYFSTTDYGADSALLKPLLHTWSLGVEEQFYLFFPILAVVAFKFFRKQFLVVLLVLSFLSLQFAVLMESINSDLNFYLPFSRFWELGAGSVLAFRELNYKPARDGYLQRISPIFGLILLLSSILVFDGNTRHPSLHTVFPILGVALIIGFASRDEWVGRLLASKPLVWTGLISYSAYLWHFPIFAFSRMGTDPSNYDKALWIAVTVFLSVVSYRYIEKPFRSKKQFSRQSLSLVLLGATASVSIGAGLAIHNHGYGERFNLYVTSSEEMQFYRREYWDDYSPFFNKQAGVLNDFPISDKHNAYVIGNSWAHDIAVSLSSLSDFNVQFKGMTGHLCNEFLVPTIDEEHEEFNKWSRECPKNITLFESVPANTDVVVIADNVFRSGQYDNGIVMAAFLKNLATLSENFDGKILIVKGRPQWRGGGFQLMMKYGPPDDAANNNVRNEMLGSLAGILEAHSYYQNFFAERGLSYVTLFEAFCNGDHCKLFGDRSVFYFDSSHLTREGSLHVSGFLKDAVLDGL